MSLNATILMAILSFNFSDSLTFVGARLHSLVTLPNEYVIQKVEGNTLKTWAFGVSADIQFPYKQTYINEDSTDNTMTLTNSSYEAESWVAYTRYRVKPIKDWIYGLKLNFLSGVAPYTGLEFSKSRVSRKVQSENALAGAGYTTTITTITTDIHGYVGVGLHVGLQLSKKLWGRQIALQFITTLANLRIGAHHYEEKRIYTEGDMRNVNVNKIPIKPYISFRKYGGPMMGVFSIYLMVQL